MSSIHKDSLSSTSTLPLPISITTANPEPVGCNSCTSGSAYPPSTLYRLAFLVARYLGVLFSLLLIGLAAASIQDINRSNWATPIFTPAFTSFFANGIDILCIVRLHRRSNHLWRLCYDGALAVGFAIALGFLVTFVRGDILRTRVDSSKATAGVAMAILCGIAAEM
jgi:hypothetical protein